MTLGTDIKRAIPVTLKRCCRCLQLRPRSESFFPIVYPNGRHNAAALHSACLVAGCSAWYARTRHAANPEALRVRLRRHHAKRNADPERKAAHRMYQREYLRRRRGTKPREADDTLTGIRVPSAPVRAAVEASPLCLNEIAAMAGRDPSGVRRSLAAEQMTASCAKAVLEALRLSPSEVGL